MCLFFFFCNIKYCIIFAMIAVLIHFNTILFFSFMFYYLFNTHLCVFFFKHHFLQTDSCLFSKYFILLLNVISAFKFRIFVIVFQNLLSLIFSLYQAMLNAYDYWDYWHFQGNTLVFLENQLMASLKYMLLWNDIHFLPSIFRRFHLCLSKWMYYSF